MLSCTLAGHWSCVPYSCRCARLAGIFILAGVLCYAQIVRERPDILILGSPLRRARNGTTTGTRTLISNVRGWPPGRLEDGGITKTHLCVYFQNKICKRIAVRVFFFWSKWRDSNPPEQLGRLSCYHYITPARDASKPHECKSGSRGFTSQSGSTVRTSPDRARHGFTCYPDDFCHPDGYKRFRTQDTF